MIHVETEPYMTAPPDVRYPRAVDQLPAPAPEAGGKPRWITVLADSLGLVLVVWSLPVAIVLMAEA